MSRTSTPSKAARVSRADISSPERGSSRSCLCDRPPPMPVHTQGERAPPGPREGRSRPLPSVPLHAVVPLPALRPSARGARGLLPRVGLRRLRGRGLPGARGRRRAFPHVLNLSQGSPLHAGVQLPYPTPIPLIYCLFAQRFFFAKEKNTGTSTYFPLLIYLTAGYIFGSFDPKHKH